MTKKDLFALLDMETGDDFSYFEDFAELMETDATIEKEDMRLLLTDTDPARFADLADAYLRDCLDTLPDGEGKTDLYTIFEAMRQNMRTLLANGGSEEREEAAGMLTAFKHWYIREGTCQATDEQQKKIMSLSVRDAIFEYRLARLDGKKLLFDFTGVGPSPIDHYTIPLADLQASLTDSPDQDQDNVKRKEGERTYQ